MFHIVIRSPVDEHLFTSCSIRATVNMNVGVRVYGVLWVYAQK